MVKRGPVRGLCRSELLAVERAIVAQGRVELERRFACLSDDDSDGITADFDNICL